MTDFIFATGGFILCAAIMMAWVFRTSQAHIAAKLVIPVAIVALGIKVAFTIDSMAGYPVRVEIRDLPDHARLVGYVEYDRLGEGDLWLMEPDKPPRAYHIKLPANTSELRSAAREIHDGTPFYLLKGKGAEGQHFHFKRDSELPAK